MILQALKDYYDRKSCDPESALAPLGWEWKEIPFLIVLNIQGVFVQIEDTREGAGKKRKAKHFLVPQGEKKSGNIKSNKLWGNAEYVLGMPREKTEDTKKVKERHKAFIKETKRILNKNPSSAAMRAIVYFLENNPLSVISSDACTAEIQNSNPNLSFRLNQGTPQNVFDWPDVKLALSDVVDGECHEKSVCLLTGEEEEIERTHPSIKGVWNAQSSGANIVSFNEDSHCSYGKQQGANAPIGKKSVFAYTTALNYLLSKNSRQKIQIGDASTVFWAEKASELEDRFSLFFTEPRKDDPDKGTEAIRSLFQSFQNGAYIKDDRDVRFFVLGLSPNAARISVRFWHVGKVSELALRIRQYFEDFSIQKPEREPHYYSLWRIMVNAAVQSKSENIPPNLGGDIVRSILSGDPYPRTLLQLLVNRIKAEREISPVRAATIKACLNRELRFSNFNIQKEISMALDPTHPSKGYQLGRLFAVLEKIQEESHPGLNATIRDRFYGAASSAPVTVFANLMKLKNHHLAKIDNRGRVTNFEKMLGEIVGNFDEFPNHLDLNEQGRFAVGYYHQRQEFFKPKENL